MTTAELRYLIALNNLFGTRLRAEKEWLAHYPQPEEAWCQMPPMDGKDEALTRAYRELEFIQAHAIQTYYYEDDTYPQRLRECPDAPILLYGKGNLNLNRGKIVSVVGTRRATERSKEITRQLVLDLSEWVPDVTIVSGLAYGIDVAAHRAALEAGIPTIIVPAHGLDRIYPNLHRDVAVQALQQGGILTEYPSGTEPEKYNFVARNRIVAGLADAVVVVESPIKGGSLITAGMAWDYNRDVFAFPGRATDDASAGCNALIRDQKATLINNAGDLVHLMRWEDAKPLARQTTIQGLDEPTDPTQQTLLAILREADENVHINSLVMETQIPYSDVAAALMMMELTGDVKGLPGGMYRAVHK